MTRPPLLALVFAMVLTGCQSRMPAPPETTDAAHRLDNVPFFAQQAYQCGPAALAMVLGWSGHSVRPETLVDEVWLPERRGSLAMELRAAARHRGRLVYPVSTPDALLSSLKADQPVLVMQNLGLNWLPRWHFAVATGFDQGGNRIVLNSGTREAMPSHWNRFVRTWARADYQGWTILPPGELPAAGEPLALVRALNELEHTAGGEAAAPFWQQAAQRFPHSYPVQFGFGNHLWEGGAREEAIAAFRAATRARPEATAAWHNLIHALAGTGCTDRARKALKAGMEETGNGRLRKLHELVHRPQEGQCPLGSSPGE